MKWTMELGKSFPGAKEKREYFNFYAIQQAPWCNAELLSKRLNNPANRHPAANISNFQSGSVPF